MPWCGVFGVFFFLIIVLAGFFLGEKARLCTDSDVHVYVFKNV
jgi:hypothetical protein